MEVFGICATLIPRLSVGTLVRGPGEVDHNGSVAEEAGRGEVNGAPIV